METIIKSQFGDVGLSISDSILGLFCLLTKDRERCRCKGAGGKPCLGRAGGLHREKWDFATDRS